MVEQLSADYANYLMNTNIDREVQPICSNIDEMILRLEEFESLLNMVKNDTQVTRQFVPQIAGFRGEFTDICQRVDSFEKVLCVINQNLSTLEQHVETAAEELGYSEKGLKGLLKPLFKEHRKAGQAVPTNLDASQNYVPAKVFEAAEYFPDSSSC